MLDAVQHFNGTAQKLEIDETGGTFDLDPGVQTYEVYVTGAMVHYCTGLNIDHTDASLKDFTEEPAASSPFVPNGRIFPAHKMGRDHNKMPMKTDSGTAVVYVQPMEAKRVNG